MSSFTATCHPSESHAEPLTFDTFPTFKSHTSECRKGSGILRRHDLAYKGKPVASARYRPFSPELGDIGSWVTMSDGTTGQVWSTIKGGKSPEVYVATGTKYERAHVRHLSPATDPASQLTITEDATPEPTPEPVAAPEPVLQAAIDSGHAVIVPVGFSEPFSNAPRVESGHAPEPAPEPKPRKMSPPERKAWNRAVADLARAADAYPLVIASWTRVSELRVAGVSPEDAVSAILAAEDSATVTPIRSAN